MGSGVRGCSLEISETLLDYLRQHFFLVETLLRHIRRRSKNTITPSAAGETTSFWPLQLPTTNPGRYSQCWAKRFLGKVMDNCKQRGSFPQAAVSGYGKLEI